jgi:2-dehydropantoate 2-reductase
MRIAIVGAGGLGGYFGALLARAGHDVVFIARGRHLEAMRREGVRVVSVHGDFHLEPVLATDRPEAVGPVELTICTVKTYDLDAVAQFMRPLVGSTTSVLPLQNGVETAERLRRHLPAEALLAGAAWIVAYVAEPGVIRQESQLRRIVIGELDGRHTQRLENIHAALLESGAQAEVSGEIEKVLWTKLLFIASFSGISSVTRAPIGPILAAAESRSLLKRAMQEVADVALAQGIPLGDDAVERGMALAESLAPDATSSMQRDAAAGRRLEYDAMSGAVVRAGQRTGVPTPVHHFLWTCLHVVDNMAQGWKA